MDKKFLLFVGTMLVLAGIMAIVMYNTQRVQTTRSKAFEDKIDKGVSKEKTSIDCTITVLKDGQAITSAKVNDRLVIKVTIAGSSTEKTSFKIKIADQTVCRSGQEDKYKQNCQTRMVKSDANSSAQISFVPKAVGPMRIKTEVGSAKCRIEPQIEISL